MKKHSENALKLAAWLSTNKEVAWVNYPGLKTSKYNDLAQNYLPKGQSGIITFGLKKGFEGGKVVADKTKLFALLANIGDTKSLIIHPASTTHQQLDEEAQKATGVTPDLIRLSVGLEDVNDLIEDLENAFASLQISMNPIQCLSLTDLKTDSGTSLAKLDLYYQHFGQALDKAPVVLINHSLTGDSDVAGQKGWWKELVGPNKTIDTNRYALLAFNIPGNGVKGQIF